MSSSDGWVWLDRTSGALGQRLRVIGAIMLQDMRTRFGRTHVSYLIAVGWPLAHLLLIFGIFVVLRRLAPIGSSREVFIATGGLPYILCLYPARWISFAIVQNRQLLNFPVISTIDLIVARTVVEFLTAFLVAAIFVGGLALGGIDMWPLDLERALGASLAAVYLGIGFGVFNVVGIALFRFWFIPFVLSMAAMYASGGVVNFLPLVGDTAREVLSYNPVLHLVTWFRSAYYDGYGDIPLDRGYILVVASTALCLGLAGNTLMRGRLLTP